MTEGRIISSRVVEWVFIVQVCVNIVFLGWLAAIQYNASQDLTRIVTTQQAIANEQRERIEEQTTQGLCNQRQIILLVINVERKLGLDTTDLTVPPKKGLDCEPNHT